MAGSHPQLADATQRVEDAPLEHVRMLQEETKHLFGLGRLPLEPDEVKWHFDACRNDTVAHSRVDAAVGPRRLRQ